MFQRILVPMDDSSSGAAILPYVEKLASSTAPDTPVEVTLLQVVTSLTYYVVAAEATAPIPYTPEELDEIKKSVAETLSAKGEGLRKIGVTVRTRVETGSVADGIERAAREIDADLIAMSTHARSAFSRMALGCVPDEVLKIGNVPLLLVRVTD